MATIFQVDSGTAGTEVLAITDAGVVTDINGVAIGGSGLLASVPLVNLNTATAATLFTVPTGKSCLVSSIRVRLASTSLSTVSLSIGWNSTSFNDVLANATHTELTGATLYTVLAPKAGAAIGTSTQVLKLLCNTLQGGAATATVDVYGLVF